MARRLHGGISNSDSEWGNRVSIVRCIGDIENDAVRIFEEHSGGRELYSKGH